ncbi:MAG: DUF4129 domain-containing protein [Candidatus Eremiobacteraeota bacterium]|nr:DUF4129 domain-containing protein [Candidatus Eremiobacteraeota bacterium]
MKAPWAHGDPRAVAHRILTDARYQTAAPEPPQKTWYDVLWEAFAAFWKRLWEPFNHLTGNEFLSRVIAIVVLVALVLGLAYLIVRLVRAYAPRRTTHTLAGAEALDAPAGARALFARALEAATQGRHHEAAALLWASALHALDEAGRVRYDAARTPGEWRRAVRDPQFDAFARDAVVALFGDRDADAALVARMRDAYDRVVTPA